MTEDKEIKREVNGTRIQTNGSLPDTKIWIGRVQNKLAVDSPRDEAKFPFWRSVLRAAIRCGQEYLGRLIAVCSTEACQMATRTATLRPLRPLSCGHGHPRPLSCGRSGRGGRSGSWTNGHSGHSGHSSHSGHCGHSGHPRRRQWSERP